MKKKPTIISKKVNKRIANTTNLAIEIQDIYNFFWVNILKVWYKIGHMKRPQVKQLQRHHFLQIESFLWFYVIFLYQKNSKTTHVLPSTTTVNVNEEQKFQNSCLTKLMVSSSVETTRNPPCPQRQEIKVPKTWKCYAKYGTVEVQISSMMTTQGQ